MLMELEFVIALILAFVFLAGGELQCGLYAGPALIFLKLV